MDGQVCKKKKLQSEYEKQLYDKVDTKILAAIQGMIKTRYVSYFFHLSESDIIVTIILIIFLFLRTK